MAEQFYHLEDAKQIETALLEMTDKRRKYLIKKYNAELRKTGGSTYYNALMYLEQIDVCNTILEHKGRYNPKPLKRTPAEAIKTRVRKKSFGEKLKELFVD